MKKGIRHTVFFTFLLYISVLGLAQDPTFTIIQQGIQSGDSSYYDVCRVAPDDFWAIGKKGIITHFGNKQLPEKISYPNRGEDLLNMTLMDDQNILICGDKGLVYGYNKLSGEWKVQQVKGYENSCFYSICAIDKNTAFLSGGRSEIVNSQRVIPFGFILKTEDGGLNWSTVYQSITSMVWSIKYDHRTNRLLALTYSPVRTKIIHSNDLGFSWKVNGKMKGLYHDFKISGDELVFAGGKNGNYLDYGVLLSGDNYWNFNCGLFWDVDACGQIALASGTDGHVAFKKNTGPWNLLSSPVSNNLYEICFVDENSAFLVGNNKTILRVNFR